MTYLKKASNLLFCASITLGAGVWLVWNYGCEEGVCDYYLVNNWLLPLEWFAYVLIAYAIVFLFLANHYFEAWLKRIFSWAFPVSVLSVLGADGGRNIMSLSKAETVLACGVVFGVLSIVFFLYWWRKTKTSDVR
jgi:hypothetical protein